MSDDLPDRLVPPSPDVAEPTAQDSAERRRIQRFLALRRGEPCFWVVIDGGARLPLRDISVEGFSIGLEGLPGDGEPFDFVMHREGVPDQIRGRARAVNYIASAAQAGCRFLALEADGAERLRDWLIALVIMNASVRINEKDAAAIVAGPSLI
ncbi:MAG TPA: PilZ domain-containing protein [Thauera sp.]|nr:PilZ domain-containing protein [Thauera sp.]